MPTVLVVDDESEVRYVIAEMLGRITGGTILEASSGVEALKVCARADCNIDLLLTDLIMPGMTGRELSEKLLARYPGMQVMFMSGYLDDAREETTEKRLHYIQKPMNMQKLQSAVSEALRRTGKA